MRIPTRCRMDRGDGGRGFFLGAFAYNQCLMTTIYTTLKE